MSADFEAIPGKGLQCSVQGVEGYMEQAPMTSEITRHLYYTPSTSLMTSGDQTSVGQPSRVYKVREVTFITSSLCGFTVLRF